MDDDIGHPPQSLRVWLSRETPNPAHRIESGRFTSGRRRLKVVIHAQPIERRQALPLGLPYDFPVIVLPGTVFPIRAGAAHRNVVAAFSQMLLTVIAESFTVPDFLNALLPDLAHAGVGGNIVAAHHHIAAAINIKPLKNERARYFIGVEVGRRIRRTRRIERRINSPGQELAFDEIIDANLTSPEPLDGGDVHSILIDP